jgi:L-fuconolactonase
MTTTDSSGDLDIVDSHAHVWTLDTELYPWRPTFGIIPTEPALSDELLAAMDEHGVAHTLLVQASAYGSDHRFLLAAVREHSDRFSPIGLIDPRDPGATELATTLIAAGCVGFRVNLALDLDIAERQAAAETWLPLCALGVPICLRATPAHQAHVIRIMARHPETRFVVDHLGLPEPGTATESIKRLSELARFDNCLLKVAGVWRASALGPPFEDVWPILAAAFDLFGSSRLMWGSDYPAARPGEGYQEEIDAIRGLSFLKANDLARVMADTARSCWKVPDRTPEP